jgi:hypothetical protein
MSIAALVGMGLGAIGVSVGVCVHPLSDLPGALAVSEVDNSPEEELFA